MNRFRFSSVTTTTTPIIHLSQIRELNIRDLKKEFDCTVFEGRWRKYEKCRTYLILIWEAGNMTLDVRSLGSKTSASLISHFLLQQTNKHINNLCTDLKVGFVVNYSTKNTSTWLKEWLWWRLQSKQTNTQLPPPPRKLYMVALSRGGLAQL